MSGYAQVPFEERVRADVGVEDEEPQRYVSEEESVERPAVGSQLLREGELATAVEEGCTDASQH